MKQLYILLLFIPSLAFAQDPINLVDLNHTIGNSFRVNATTPQDIGSGGSGQVWDYSNMFSQSANDAVIVNPEVSGVASQFAAANAALEVNLGVNFEFYQVNALSYEYCGAYDGSASLVYEDCHTYLSFPAELGSAWEDTYAFSYDFGTVTGEVDGVYDAEVDGFGTLILPWGTIENVYRVFGTINQNEVFDNGLDVYEAQFLGSLTTWWAEGYPIPLMTNQEGVILIPDLGISQDFQSTGFANNFEFLSTEDIELAQEIKTWPLPANDILNISFETIDESIRSIEILDVTGKVVTSEGINAGPGFFQTQMDVSELAAGYYLLRLVGEKGVQGVKIAVR